MLCSWMKKSTIEPKLVTNEDNIWYILINKFMNDLTQIRNKEVNVLVWHVYVWNKIYKIFLYPLGKIET